MSSTSAVTDRVLSPSEGRRQDEAAGERALRVLRPRRAAPDRSVRPTRAEIDLSALRHNLQVVRRAAGNARVWAVLKADGYGHGAPAVARTLERAGADGMAVALLEEAVELRDAGIRAPILVMGGYYGSSYDELLAHDLVPVIYDASHVEGLSRALRARRDDGDVRAKVHLKIDTGMSRLGVRVDDLDPLLDALRGSPCPGAIEIDGVMTHLACADSDGDAGAESIAEQLALFARGVEKIRRAGFVPRTLHAANSAALLRSTNGGVDARFDAVRPGIALFGVDPLGVAQNLKRTMRVRTEVVALRTIPAGTPVGYGSTWRAPRETVIATVPAGYADGLPRALSNSGAMLVRGKRAPIVGVLSMDLATLDVTEIPGVRLHDEVVALGDQRGPLGEGSIGVEEVARLAGLIPWDVMTSISRRVPRFYRER
jgi:alanine racemase